MLLVVQWTGQRPALFTLASPPRGPDRHVEFKYKKYTSLATWTKSQISLFASQFSLAMLNIQKKTDEVGYNILFLEQKCKLILYSILLLFDDQLLHLILFWCVCFVVF